MNSKIDISLMDPTEFAISFLNSHFDSNIKSLTKLTDVINEIQDRKEEIECQLVIASRTVPDQIRQVSSASCELLSEIKHIDSDRTALCSSVRQHVDEMKPSVKNHKNLICKIQEVEKYSMYLTRVVGVEKCSSEIHGCLLKEDVNCALTSFFYMVEMYSALQKSSCQHLLAFTSHTILFWNGLLSNIVSEEFSQLLATMSYPMVPVVSKSVPVINTVEAKTQLCKLLKQLFMLQLPDSIYVNSQSVSALQKLPGMKPLTLPMQLMVKPLQKRFEYHFHGRRQTNVLEKPEWYLTQVLGWIHDHWDFIDQIIQPLLGEAGYTNVCAKTEFMQGMVMLVLRKLSVDLPNLLSDDLLFSHTVDEVLIFDRELQLTHGYPTKLPRCLDLFLKHDIFQKWLSVERKYAVEKVERMLESTSAWQSQYKDISDVEEALVPECAEGFMTLLSTMTERYKSLPSSATRVQFLSLQFELLEDFRIRVVQVMKEAGNEPCSPIYSAVLNASHYVVRVLREWNEQVFFLQLQLYRTNQLLDIGTAAQLTNTHQPSVLEEVSLLDKTVFDSFVELFHGITADMLKKIVGHIFTDVQSRSHCYRKDKRWLSVVSQAEMFSTIGLSSSACEMLLVLKEHLSQIQHLLSPPMFTMVWKGLAARLNTFLLNDVILANHFSAGGSVQLQFDMTRNLLPLFGSFTAKPEAYFREVREACTLLTLTTGTALLVKDVLRSALHDTNGTDDADADPRAVLNEAGVFCLSVELAESVLTLRTDLPTL